MHLKKIISSGALLFVIFLFSLSASAFEIDTLLSDTLKTDTAYKRVYWDTTFDTHGRTKILTRDGQKYLYYNLSLTKKHDRIRQIFLDKYLIYDSQVVPETNFTLLEKGWYRYHWDNTSIKHGLFLEKRKAKEKETVKVGGEYKEVTKWIYWKEDKLNLKGRVLMDSLTYLGEYKVLYDTGKEYKDTIEFDLDKSVKQYLDIAFGETFAWDKIYKNIPDDWHIAGMTYYSLGYGFTIKQHRAGLRLFYNGYDLKEEKDNVKSRKHMYWWEVYSYISQKKWFSFDTNLELEAGYKAGKRRGYKWEDDKNQGILTEFYNFSFRDHGPSLGATLNYKFFGLKYEYSWVFGGYHTFSLNNWFSFNGNSQVGTVFKQIQGKNVRDYMIVFEVRASSDRMISKQNENWIGWSSVVIGAGVLISAIIISPFERIFCGGNCTN